MRSLKVWVLCILLVSIIGCSSQKVSSQSGQHKSIPQGRSLPAPDNPLVGKNPPMPAFTAVSMLEGYKVETFASGLAVPWDLAFASKNRIYVTERPGRVRLIENGRIRAVVVGPDGALYITTSNRDGRGRVRPGDDKILRISPE